MSEFFQASTGVIFEIDVPAPGTIARERHDAKIAAGDLMPLDTRPVTVDMPGGGYRWQATVDPEPEPEPEPEPDTATPEPEAQPEPARQADGPPPDSNVGDVLAWVDSDPQRAQTALDVEQSEAGKGRSSLIRDLLAVIDE